MPEVRSPCISMCVYNSNRKYCTGCFRNVEDIQEWWDMSDSEKRKALKRCKENKKKSNGK